MTATTRFGATARFFFLCIGILTGCTAPDRIPPTVILASIEGFHWDYVDRPAAPTLQAIASRGLPVIDAGTKPLTHDALPHLPGAEGCRVSRQTDRYWRFQVPV